MRQRWGTFSVRDHCLERPFVAEVLLFDKLVIPVPPDGKEAQRWERNGWMPEKQTRVLGLLEKKGLVVKVPWDAVRRKTFRRGFKAAKAAHHEGVNAYAMTAHQLLTDQQLTEIRDMPVRPQMIAGYRSRKRFRNDVAVVVVDKSQVRDTQRKEELAMAIGYEFLVPDESYEPSDELDLELLRRAIAIATRDRFREKRAAFYEWIDRAVADQYTNQEALGEMNKLLKAYTHEVEAAGIKTRVDQAFLVAGTGLAVAGHFFPPLWVGAVAIAPAKYVVSRVLPHDPFWNVPPAMLYEAKQGLSNSLLERWYRAVTRRA